MFQSTRAPEDARDSSFGATFSAADRFQSTRAPEDARDRLRGGLQQGSHAVSIHARARGRARRESCSSWAPIYTFQSTRAPEDARDIRVSAPRASHKKFQSTRAP